MNSSIRNTIIIVICIFLIWIFWRILRGFLVVMLLIGVIALLIYIIMRTKK